MARHSFGQSLTDWTMELSGDAVVVAPGQLITFWNLPTGGVRYLDLLDAGGVAATSITSAGEGDPLPPGTIPQFSGPDGVTAMWADGGAGVRYLMVATDLGAGLADLQGRMDNAENIVANLEALTASVILAVRYDEGTSTWPVRPALAGARVVYWHGPDSTPPPAGYMADGDEFFGWL